MIYNSKALREVLDILVRERYEYQGMIDAIGYAKTLSGVRDGEFENELSDALESFLNVGCFLVSQELLAELTEEQYEAIQSMSKDNMEALIDRMVEIQVPLVVAGLAATAITLDVLNGTGQQTWDRVALAISSQLPATTDAEC